MTTIYYNIGVGEFLDPSITENPSNGKQFVYVGSAQDFTGMWDRPFGRRRGSLYHPTPKRVFYKDGMPYIKHKRKKIHLDKLERVRKATIKDLQNYYTKPRRKSKRRSRKKSKRRKSRRRSFRFGDDGNDPAEEDRLNEDRKKMQRRSILDWFKQNDAFNDDPGLTTQVTGFFANPRLVRKYGTVEGMEAIYQAHAQKEAEWETLDDLFEAMREDQERKATIYKVMVKVSEGMEPKEAMVEVMEEQITRLKGY